MDDNIIEALITLVFGTILGGFFGLLFQYRGKVVDKIWDERYKIYAELWKISKSIPKYPPNLEIHYSNLIDISKQLRFWYFEKNGGVLLSEVSKDAYINLQKKINHIAKSDETIITNQEYETLQNCFSILRSELTADLMSRKRGITLFD